MQVHLRSLMNPDQDWEALARTYLGVLTSAHICPAPPGQPFRPFTCEDCGRQFANARELEAEAGPASEAERKRKVEQHKGVHRKVYTYLTYTSKLC